MRKNKFIKFFSMLSALAFTCVFAFGVAACGGGDDDPDDDTTIDNTDDGSTDGGSTQTNFTITFHYGFDAADYDYTAGKVPEDKYTSSSSLTSKNGKKVTLSSVFTAQFEVTGFTVTGYSTTAWGEDNITADMDVYVLYAAKGVATVQFLNYDDTVIKTVTSYEGDTISGTEYPDTDDIIIAYTASQLGSTSGYVLLDSGVYIASADQDRLDEAVLVPYGYYFSAWEGSTDNLVTGTTTVKATVAAGDGIAEKTTASNTINATWDSSKAAFYGTKLYSLQHTVKLSLRSSLEDSANTIITDDSVWAAAATTASTKSEVSTAGTIDAEVYMRWDGDLIYFYVRVTDPYVVTNGEDYVDGVTNGWLQDGVEMWITMGDGDYTKIFIDAYGYEVKTTYGEGTASKYIDYIRDNSLYATTILDANGNALNKTNADYSSSKGQKVIRAAGYDVEFAIPAFRQPSSDVTSVSATLGGENWGERLTTGQKIYVSLQVDNSSWYASDEYITNAISYVAAGGNAWGENYVTANLTSAELAEIDFVAYGGHMLSTNSRNIHGKITILG